jgi:hypothetical protein
MVLFHFGLCFVEYTVLTDKYLLLTLIVVLLRSVWWHLFFNVPVSYKSDIKDCVMFKYCAAPSEAFNILWYVLQIAHAAFVKECINVGRFNWIGHVYFRDEHHHMMDAFIAGYRFWGFLIVVGLRFYAMLLLFMCVKLHLNIAPVLYKNSHTLVFIQRDFCQLINVCC